MYIRTIVLAVILEHFVLGQLSYILGKVGDELRQLRLSLKGPAVQNSLLDEDIEEYDFIVVGAGSAGAVVASRLSENPNYKVLLIEAGTSETIINQIPYASLVLFATQYAWTYKSTPQVHSCFGRPNNQCYIRTGRGLGGGSAINGIIYARGNKVDFDNWASKGNPGWSYEEILPYFKKSENVKLENYEPDYHQEEGPLTIEDNQYINEDSKAFITGAKELGYNEGDYNGINSLGVASYGQFISRNGRRQSTSKAYLEPARFRKNLIIKTNSQANRILFDSNGKAESVLYKRGKRHLKATVRKEIIISCGALNTPQLLMVSGIGPEDHLRELGIPLVQNLKVGYNLIDHLAFIGLNFYYDYNTTQNIIKDGADWFLRGNGPFSSAGLNGVLYFNTNQNLNYPDIELALILSIFNNGHKLLKLATNIDESIYNSVWKQHEGKRGFSILIELMIPKSVGRITIQSNSTFTPPLINLNYLSEEEDVDTLIKAIRKTLKFAQTETFKRLNIKLNTLKVAGCEMYPFDSDSYWACAIRIQHISSYHYFGTCKMGPNSDVEAVVDNRLKVYGVKGLRVVDTSVIPAHITGHLEAPAVMIAEKASDLIKLEWG
ncbi:glucose-methanol-choline gmc oxidoreductase [Holotrichia oblita]|uniref:Glucose-methanol-choline gmc oxidoreductase n=1 Tax=Holotrichia oblita TaxID=644536 RepID=A0ACB9SIF8_HOLOL|nr:glucose-methanol-choline gmc oxidoreductase [Holotrichia oblita]